MERRSFKKMFWILPVGPDQHVVDDALMIAILSRCRNARFNLDLFFLSTSF